MTLDRTPWWAKLSATSALAIIALVSVYNSNIKVDAKMTEAVQNQILTIQSLAGIERMLGKHIDESQATYYLLRAMCLNNAVGSSERIDWARMQNCLDPQAAASPTVSGRPLERPQGPLGRMFDR